MNLDKAHSMSAYRMIASAAYAALGLGIFLSGPGRAQEHMEPSTEKICMVLGSGASSGAIVLSKSDESALLAKGFVRTPCDEAFASEAEQRDWRDRICRFVATAPEGMQKNMEGAMGERPAILCGMAEVVLGPWDQSQIYD